MSDEVTGNDTLYLTFTQLSCVFQTVVQSKRGISMAFYIILTKATHTFGVI